VDVPFGLALLVAVFAVLGGWWAFRFHQQVLALVRPAGEPATGVHSSPDDDAVIPGWPRGPGGGAGEARSRPTTGEREQESTSVLGWGQFRVVSVLAHDGMAIVACRGADGAARPGAGVGGLGGRRLDRTSKPSSWPLLLATDTTMVVLIGHGDPATQALKLLDRWRRTDAVLGRRETPVAGGVEFFDGHHFALRALLLAG
jgi:hypothetical protein